MRRTLLGVLAGLLLVAAGIFWWQGRVEPEVGTLPAAAPASGGALALPSGTGGDPRGAAPPEASAITREQRRFDRFDRDRNGRITRTEILLPRVPAFKKLDANGDNLLSFEEWAARTTTKFQAADANHDGWLSRPEYATTKPKPKPKPACRCAAPARKPAARAGKAPAAPPSDRDDESDDDAEPAF